MGFDPISDFLAFDVLALLDFSEVFEEGLVGRMLRHVMLGKTTEDIFGPE